jgi:hypothetical protein
VAKPFPASLFAFPSVLARVDLERTALALDALFRRHGARGQSQPADRLVCVSRGGFRAVASFALESDRITRAVVTHVRMAPFFAGVALVVHPRAELDAPLLVGDVMIPPTGGARAYLDACGPAIASPTFAARFKDPLASIVDGARGVRRETVPAWIAPLSGGGGARLRARPGRGDGLARLLLAYVDRYLHALAAAQPARDAAANRAATLAVRDAFAAHGRARARLARAFGSPFTEGYTKLLWDV